MNKKINYDDLKRFVKAGYTAREVAQRLDCSERQVKRLKKQLKLKADTEIRNLRRHLQREGLVNEAAQVFRMAGVSSRMAADVLGVSHTAVSLADRNLNFTDLTHVSGECHFKNGDEWL